jgi:alanine dehydrogenase
MAVGMGAHVTIIDKQSRSTARARRHFPFEDLDLASSAYMIPRRDLQADLIVGAGARAGARRAESRHARMLKDVPNGAVIVDVAVDQGRLHRDFASDYALESDLLRGRLLHYCVANMPGACRALRRSH